MSSVSVSCNDDDPSLDEPDGNGGDVVDAVDSSDPADGGDTVDGTDLDGGAESGDGDAADTADAADAQDGGGDADAGDGPPECLRPKFKATAPTSCQSSPRPDRCSADLTTFDDWGAASTVTSLELTTDAARTRAFDLNFAEGPDNQMASILGLFGNFGTGVDKRIEQNIDQGELLLVLEHHGLSSIPSASSFAVNPLLGAFAEGDQTDATTHGTPYLARPSSFESGTFPATRLENASIEQGTFSAGPGRLDLRLQVSIFDVTIPIRGATIQSSVDEGKSDPSAGGDGVALGNGRLGGYVLLTDLFGVLDDLYGQCACLDSPETTFELPPGQQPDDPDLCEDLDGPGCDVSCKMSVADKADKCEPKQDGTLCSNLTAACGATQFIKDAADLDVDCDGTKDAVSLSAVFEAAGGRISGVAPSVAVDNQTVAASGGDVTVRRTFVSDKRWLVLRAVDDKGRPGRVVGHTSSPLTPGLHSGVTISVDSDVTLQDGWGLFVALHRDDGNGSFDFDASQMQSPDGIVRDARGRPVAARFAVNVR